jgi:hypothetical protein
VETYPENRVFYLSIIPSLFETAVASLKQSGLIAAPHAEHWTRVVIEKPFGKDLESAKALNAELLRHLDESQIYRIDHYLGKETVQNILSFRFANAIFEPVFNRSYVDHIQKFILQLRIGICGGNIAFVVADVLYKPQDGFIVGRNTGKLLNGFDHHAAKDSVVVFAPGKADDGKLFGEQLLRIGNKQRRDQLAARQVARRTKNNDGNGVMYSALANHTAVLIF